MFSLTVDILLKEATTALTPTSPSPSLDAQILLGHLLKRSSLSLFLLKDEVILPHIAEEFRCAIARRIQGIPVAYITGEKEFWSSTFRVSPAVLIPRPESELLVEEALRWLEKNKRKFVRVLDLGTGSGCLIISLLKECNQRGISARGLAVDISLDALSVAQENATKLDVQVPLSFIESNWFSQVGDDQFDIIIANPPYVGNAEKAELRRELFYEPSHALFSGDDGLQDVTEILCGLKDFIAPEGLFLCEIGAFHGEVLFRTVSKLWAGTPIHCKVLNDLAGFNRCLRIDFSRITQGADCV
jgi:release factor glutamine methyltransferase